MKTFRVITGRGTSAFTSCILPLLIAGCYGSSSAETSSQPPQACLITLPLGSPSGFEFDVGEVAAGTRAVVPVSFQNRTGTSVQIAKVETSCECLNVEDAIRTLDANESIAVQLVVDLTSKPNYAGDLAIEVIGYDASGVPTFRLSVLLAVRTTPGPPSEAPLPDPVPMPVPLDGAPDLNSKAES